VEARESPALDQLADAIRASAWELALATVDEGLLDDQIPSFSVSGVLASSATCPRSSRSWRESSPSAARTCGT
jgi:hypothetical protein